jgi:hypothetical protein
MAAFMHNGGGGENRERIPKMYLQSRYIAARWAGI